MLSSGPRSLDYYRGHFCLLIVGVVFLGYCSGASVGADQVEAEKQFEALRARYKAESDRAWAELEKVTDATERAQLYENRHPANSMIGDFLKFEEANRGTLLGLSALHHLVSIAGGNGFAPQFSASE